MNPINEVRERLKAERLEAKRTAALRLYQSDTFAPHADLLLAEKTPPHAKAFWEWMATCSDDSLLAYLDSIFEWQREANELSELQRRALARIESYSTLSLYLGHFVKAVESPDFCRWTLNGRPEDLLLWAQLFEQYGRDVLLQKLEAFVQLVNFLRPFTSVELGHAMTAYAAALPPMRGYLFALRGLTRTLIELRDLEKLNEAQAVAREQGQE